MTAIETRVVEALQKGPLTLSELCLEIEFSRTPVYSAIRVLEAQGQVKAIAFKTTTGRPARVYQWAGGDPVGEPEGR